MAITGWVIDIDRFSTHDGPGIRTAIFLQGCPLRCAWCHSPESQPGRPVLLYQGARCARCGACVDRCPTGALHRLPDGKIRVDREACVACFACAQVCPTRALYPSSREITLGEVERILRQDRPFFRNSGGGVTVSGGEPLAQASFLLGVLELSRTLGVHSAVETSGWGEWEDLKAAAELADLLFYDVKLLEEGEHRRWTGVGNAGILEGLARLCTLPGVAGKIVVRTPCIPGVNDSVEQVGEIARFVRELGVSRMEPLPYNPMAGSKYEWIGAAYPLGEVAAGNREGHRVLEEAVRRAGLAVEAGEGKEF